VTFWAEVFLGVIAISTFTMAALQVGVIVYGWTVTRRVNRMLAQVEQEMKPVTESLASIARDAARISSMASGQVERVDKLVTDVTTRIEQTAATVQDTVLKPLRDGAAAMAAVKAAVEVFRDVTRPAGPKRPRTDEDDPLFIG
jgi:hypothetical protein